MLPAYEQTKQVLRVDLGVSNVLLTQVVAGNVGGFVTACAVLPVDVIKTRMQNQSGAAQSIGVVMRDVYARGGLAAFYVGFMPMWCVDIARRGADATVTRTREAHHIFFKGSSSHRIPLCRLLSWKSYAACIFKN